MYWRMLDCSRATGFDCLCPRFFLLVLKIASPKKQLSITQADRLNFRKVGHRCPPTFFRVLILMNLHSSYPHADGLHRSADLPNGSRANHTDWEPSPPAIEVEPVSLQQAIHLLDISSGRTPDCPPSAGQMSPVTNQPSDLFASKQGHAFLPGHHFVIMA